MKFIRKTTAPQEFVDYCASTPGICFDNLGPYKRILRKKLLDDQGYICCYCGREIKNEETTKIEHIKCQDRYKELALNFDNMLASCDGGEKDRHEKVTPKHKKHCDAKKNNDDIPISPLDQDIEKLLIYYEDGTVYSGNDKGRELIRILGLDTGYLQMHREKELKKYKKLPLNELKDELNYTKELHDGKYIPYCFVIEQYLLALIKDKTAT